MKFKAVFMLLVLGVSACVERAVNLNSGDGVFAPGVAEHDNTDAFVVGNRLMAAGEYELALKSYQRSALQQGVSLDLLSALGSVHLKLGQLRQAENILRQAIKRDENFIPAWNNLGVVLMARGQVSEAEQVFRRAYAMDNGNSDQIRNNLRLALARLDQSDYIQPEDNASRLVRRGSGEYVLLAP